MEQHDQKKIFIGITAMCLCPQLLQTNAAQSSSPTRATAVPHRQINTLNSPCHSHSCPTCANAQSCLAVCEYLTVLGRILLKSLL